MYIRRQQRLPHPRAAAAAGGDAAAAAADRCLRARLRPINT